MSRHPAQGSRQRQVRRAPDSGPTRLAYDSETPRSGVVPQPALASAEILNGRGRFDCIENGTAVGWAFSPGDEPVWVVILADGVPVMDVQAVRERPDVAASGLSDGQQKVGFACRLPADPNGRLRRFTARIGGTGIDLPGEHEWRDGAALFVSGHFSVRHGRVQSCFSLPRGAVRPDAVVLEEAGKAIQSFAPHFDADDKTNGLAVATIDERLPVSLRDGCVHRLTLRVAGTHCFLRPDTPGHVLKLQFFVRGVVDNVRNGVLSGWAYDVRRPSDPVLVEVLDGDRVLVTGEAGQQRGDVGALFPDGARAGFSIHLPLSIYDNAKHRLRVRAAGEELALPAEAISATLKVDAAGTREQRIVGRVEDLNYRRVTGYAAETGSNLPVTVRIEVDGLTVGRAVANLFERRFAVDGHHGYSGFSFEFAATLMNGLSRRVRVIPDGSTAALAAPAEKLVFPLIMLPPDPANERPAPVEAGHCWARPRAGRPAGQAGGCRLSMIVVNWNGAAYLDKMLASLAVHVLAFAFEIIVVDHGSSDDSEAVVQRWADRLPLRWLQRGANYSFSDSNNFGAAQAAGEFLVFANNDLEFPTDCLTPGLARFDDRELGILGFRLQEPVPWEDGWGLRDHHMAVIFKPMVLTKTRSVFLPYETDAPHPPLHVRAIDVGAVTAALMMCRATDFREVGGFSEAYSYGLEDVDLCVRARAQLGRKVICDQTLIAVHDRSATRGRKSAAATLARPYSAQQAQQNRSEFLRRHARPIARSILNEAMEGCTRLTRRKLRVTFAVTEASMHTSAGDYFTALELAIALRSAFGWEAMFVAHVQHDLADTDVLVLMRHDYDLSRVVNAAPTLLVVAWIRNRVDQWCDGPNLPRCQLVFASSQRSIDEVRARHNVTAHLLPIATNPDRFSADPDDAVRSGLAFTGNYWGHPRETAELAQVESLGMDLQIYGSGWERHPTLGRHWHGARPYYELPEVYARSAIVLDDSHPVTRDWDSLNSRVFDALAAGSLVVTNCAGGAAELFGDRLPSFTTQNELHAILSGLAADPDARRSRARLLQAEVLEHHTYAVRARTMHAAMRDFCAGAVRVAIKIGVPKDEEKAFWGDYHFALGLQRALQRLGFWVRIDLLPEWNAGYTVGDDVAIVLRGLSRHAPAPGVANIMWLISHPDEVALEEMKGYDHVFVASDSFAQRLKPRLGDKVSSLLQCADPALFHPLGEGEVANSPAPGPVFVGNTRGHSRQLVDWSVQEEIALELHGQGWAATPAAPLLVSEHVPNDRLRLHYASASIVLGDHWPDMRAEGFISNRLFDAACCGALLAVDDVAGLREVFGDLPVVCRSPGELRAAVDEAAAGDTAGTREALRSLVLANHTFDHRARRIADVIATLQ